MLRFYPNNFLSLQHEATNMTSCPMWVILSTAHITSPYIIMTRILLICWETPTLRNDSLHFGAFTCIHCSKIQYGLLMLYLKRIKVCWSFEPRNPHYFFFFFKFSILTWRLWARDANQRAAVCQEGKHMPDSFKHISSLDTHTHTQRKTMSGFNSDLKWRHF